jgi:hypothetical protein
VSRAPWRHQPCALSPGPFEPQGYCRAIAIVNRQALAHVARRVRDLNALKPGLSVRRATDILWFYLGREAWHLLVSGRRWSWDDAERWLREQTCTALIDPQ